MHARADRRLNRVRVLQAAATLAATRGLSFSMSDVAELAQVSRSTVHRAFAGKAELLDAVAIDGWERTLATVRNHRVRAERSVAPVTLRHFERAVLDVAEDFIRADAFIVGAEQIAGRKPADVIPLVGMVEHELSRLYEVVADEAGPPRPGAIGDVLAIVTSYRAPERVNERVALLVDALAPRGRCADAGRTATDPAHLSHCVTGGRNPCSGVLPPGDFALINRSV